MKFWTGTDDTLCYFSIFTFLKWFVKCKKSVYYDKFTLIKGTNVNYLMIIVWKSDFQFSILRVHRYIDISRIFPRIETPLFLQRSRNLFKDIDDLIAGIRPAPWIMQRSSNTYAKINVYRSSKCVNRSKCEPNIDMRHAYENSMACIGSRHNNLCSMHKISDSK